MAKHDTGRATTTVYKVVEERRFLGIFPEKVSAIVEGKARVSYKPNKWVEAPAWLSEKGYDLTAFVSYEAAKKFSKGLLRWANFAIWEGEAEGVLTELPPTLDIYDLEEGKMTILPDPWPEGTVMCRRLELVKRIK